MGGRVAIIPALFSMIVGIATAQAESRAADLYYRGLVEVDATLPRSNLTIPSTAMPCVNCHGADGLGGREGGVAVPSISWRRLAMATAERPAYDQTLLARALRDGIGTDGALLHDIMPRYALPDALVHELKGWLQTIRPAHIPGISADEITIAIPPAKPDDPRAAVIASVLHLYADQFNRKGGVYGRTIRLIEDAAGINAFARLASLTPQATRAPGILDLWPLKTRPGEDPDFSLIPSDARLMQSLLKAAKRDDPAALQLSKIPGEQNLLPRTFVFDGQPDVLSAFIDQWQGPASLAIYTTPDHIDLAALRDLPPRPLRLVLANPLATGEATVPAENTPHHMAFQKATEHLHLPKAAEAIAKATWVAASLLEDGLRRTGRNLDQERFKIAMKSISTLDSGLVPAVHPVRGLTSIGLIKLDLSTDSIARLRLALD